MIFYLAVTNVAFKAEFFLEDIKSLYQRALYLFLEDVVALVSVVF